MKAECREYTNFDRSFIRNIKKLTNILFVLLLFFLVDLLQRLGSAQESMVVPMVSCLFKPNHSFFNMENVIHILFDFCNATLSMKKYRIFGFSATR